MSDIQQIIKFLEDKTGIPNIKTDSDIFSMGVYGDDFHELMNTYAETFDVDMSEYLWYFHTNEEGINIGMLFFRPPYMRVKRIPVTPLMLNEFVELKRWYIEYPEHKLPYKRYDLIISKILIWFIIIITVSLLLIYEL